MPKILAIDDNKDNLIIIKALIQEIFKDAIVFTAISGAKGLELAAAEIPDVILLDIVMPGLSGWEVCRRIKANPTTTRIPVIIQTVRHTLGEQEVIDRAHPDGLIAKPFAKSELLSAVETVLEQKASDGQPPFVVSNAACGVASGCINRTGCEFTTQTALRKLRA